MRLRTVLVLPLATALLASACADSKPTTAPDPPDPRIRWTQRIQPGIYYGSPALSLDQSTVYFGTSVGSEGTISSLHALHALDVSTGASLWTFPLGGAEVRSSPAVGPDGSITFLVDERNVSGGFVKTEVVRVSAAGTEVWRRPLGIAGERVEVGFSAPAIAADGAVFVAADSLYALNDDGTVRWTRFSTGADLRSSPTIGSDGTVYFVAHNLPLTALNPANGETIWSVALEGNAQVFAAPALGSDGSVYVGTDDCKLFAVSSGGQVQWTYDAAAGGSSCSIRTSPAVGNDGTVYFGTTDRRPAPAMFAVRANGTLRWVFTPANLPADVSFVNFDIYSSPAIGTDGSVYFGHEFGRIYNVDAGSGAEKWLVRTPVGTGVLWSSPAVTTTGVLLVSTQQGDVFALTTESSGLSGGAAWPRFRGTNRSAGRR